MHLARRVKIQLAIFMTIALTACTVMLVRYINVPANVFGVGRYTVTVDLPRAGGLYPHGNVTYRGTQVGRIDSVHITNGGVAAILSLNSNVKIPSDLRAEVHSQSAVSEQYIALIPQSANAIPLKDGAVIPISETSVPPDIDTLLDATNRGLTAIPGDDLQTVIDESYTAVHGLGPDLSRLVRGSTTLSIDADRTLEAWTALMDNAPAVLDSQTDTADDIQSWARHLASISGQLATHNSAVSAILSKAPSALDQSRQLLASLQPTLPILLANLTSLTDVALVYQPAIEQLLVLLPQGIGNLQGANTANLNTKQAYRGMFLDFNLNINLPPTCSTGFLPPQQKRPASMVDYPDRAPGDLYCRVPQDSPFNVRGARNYPCLTVPGKRAPSVKMCESNEQYVPLNDGFNWKGDPNATSSGQSVPQLLPEPHAAMATPSENSSPEGAVSQSVGNPPTIGAAEYDPDSGSYVGPDGRLYTLRDLARSGNGLTWQDLLRPPSN